MVDESDATLLLGLVGYEDETAVGDPKLGADKQRGSDGLGRRGTFARLGKAARQRLRGQRCQGIVYRSRTTPQRSANLAFVERAPLTATTLGRLGEQSSLLATAVVSDGFTVDGGF